MGALTSSHCLLEILAVQDSNAGVGNSDINQAVAVKSDVLAKSNSHCHRSVFTPNLANHSSQNELGGQTTDFLWKKEK